MEYKEFTGKTVEEAITNATVELGVPSDEIGYEVLEEGSKGFLGLNSKPARIKVWKKADLPVEEIVAPEPVAEPVVEETAAPEPVAEEKTSATKVSMDSNQVTAEIKKFLSQVFEAMQMEVTINIQKSEEEENVYDVDLEGDDMGVLIGKRGQTLDSLQYLTNLSINKHSEDYIRVKIDTEDYRRRRKETLENLAKNLAYKVKRSKKPVELEPMNPFERRVIHSALQNDRFVTTHSEGEEPYRHVVITLKK